MSCLDVMYHQSYGAHYLPADAYRAACYSQQQQQQQQRKLSLHTKMQSCSGQQQQQQQQQAGGRAALCRDPDLRPAPGSQAGCTPLPEPELKEGVQPAGAEYLNSRCVLFTYFQGDIGDVVDQHFSRALSQAASFGRDSKGSRIGSSPPLPPPPPGAAGSWRDGASVAEGLSSSVWSGSYSSHPASCLPSVSVSVHPDFSPLPPGEGALWAGHVLSQAGPPLLAALPDSWSYGLNSPGAAGYANVHEVYHPHAHAHPHAHIHARPHPVFHPFPAHSPALDSRFSPLLLAAGRSPGQQAAGSPHSDKAELETCGGGGGSPVTAPPPSWTPSPLHGPLEPYDPVLDATKAKTSVWF